MPASDAIPEAGAAYHVGDAEPLLRSVARVETSNASRHLQQLCKHFAHKVPTRFDRADGRIEFPIGEVVLSADAAGLDLSLACRSASERADLEDVVARHLVRFAFRDELTVDWHRAGGDASMAS